MGSDSSGEYPLERPPPPPFSPPILIPPAVSTASIRADRQQLPSGASCEKQTHVMRDRSGFPWNIKSPPGRIKDGQGGKRSMSDNILYCDNRHSLPSLSAKALHNPDLSGLCFRVQVKNNESQRAFLIAKRTIHNRRI